MMVGMGVILRNVRHDHPVQLVRLGCYHRKVPKCGSRKKTDAYFFLTNNSEVSGPGWQGSCAHRVIQGPRFLASLCSAIIENVVPIRMVEA